VEHAADEEIGERRHQRVAIVTTPSPSSRHARSAAAKQSIGPITRHDGLLRFARNDGSGRDTCPFRP
jgi:hypothetical protein